MPTRQGLSRRNRRFRAAPEAVASPDPDAIEVTEETLKEETAEIEKPKADKPKEEKPKAKESKSKE